MGKFIDITGSTFGKLLVVKRVENNKYNHPMWLCKCDCGKEKEISGCSLNSGLTKSCGRCSINNYEFKDDYVIGYTKKGEKFLIDLDDYEKVSKYNWRVDYHGYIVTKSKNKVVRLHRLIMNPNKNEVVDHKFHKTYDNRKSQLRVCSSSKNSMNKNGVKGYTWDKSTKRYKAHIFFNSKRHHIGSYKTKDEARLAYCEKAIKLFGEFVHEDVVKDYERLNKKLKMNK